MMRWRLQRPITFFTRLGEGSSQGEPPLPRGRCEWRAETIEDQWVTLRRHCADEPSRLRLGRLLHRLAQDDPGVQESALAELELATQLARAGVHLLFLPESRVRTADLECHLGHERFFVEVTAMVGAAAWRRISWRRLGESSEQREETHRGAIFTHRILARVRQKAKQLVEYCEPVVLQISVPRANWQGWRAGRSEATWLDVTALADAVTVLLTNLPHLSAVLIALWDVEPLPWRAGIRLANVEVIVRASHQRAVPRVRMLVRNPRANAPLTTQQREVLRAIL
jgi:hypothetical protein